MTSSDRDGLSHGLETGLPAINPEHALPSPKGLLSARPALAQDIASWALMQGLAPLVDQAAQRILSKYAVWNERRPTSAPLPSEPWVVFEDLDPKSAPPTETQMQNDLDRVLEVRNATSHLDCSRAV